MNTIAEHKTSDLIIQVDEMFKDNFIGRVLVGNSCNPVGVCSTWSTKSFNISNNEPKEDKIVTQVVEKFKQRSKVGIEKYGTTLEENNTDDFYQHLSEELMDSLLYLQKLKDQNKNYNSLLDKYNELVNDFKKLESKKDSSVDDFSLNTLYLHLKRKGCIIDKTLNDFSENEIVEYLMYKGYKVKYKF